MKKLSFLLVVLLLTTVLSHTSSAQDNNCGYALSRLYACTAGGKCCAKVDDVAEHCPRRLRRPFMRTYNRCKVENPVTPANSPPGFVCSPYEHPEGCDDEMSAFWYRRSSAISSVCCNWVVQLLDNCPRIPRNDFFIKPQQYCRNNIQYH